jgi:hypothetical protein
VSPVSVVVFDVGGEDFLEMSAVEHNDVIQALSSDRADNPLSIRILPRALRCGENLVEPVQVQKKGRSASLENGDETGGPYLWIICNQGKT